MDREAPNKGNSDDRSRKFVRTVICDFIRKLAETKEELVVIHPEVTGDNYEEIVERLNRLADAGKQLAIVPRKEQ